MTLRASDQPATAATTVGHSSGVAPSLSGMVSGIGTKPESAEWAAIRSLAGDNRTFSNTATVQRPGNSPNSLGAAVASPHRASDCPARRVPAGLFGPSHPAPGDFGCFLIQKL